MTFWILITLMALLIVAVLGLTMLRGRCDDEPAAAYDLRVYREQLAGVDRDLARGVIAETDADRIRTEISRRILAADAEIRRQQQGGGPGRRLALVTIAMLALVLIGGTLVLYDRLGAPGYGDLPLTLRLQVAENIRSERPDQTTVEARLDPVAALRIDQSYADLLAQLRATVAGRPDDVQGHRLLAQHEANVGDFKAAYTAQARVIELTGDASADDYAELAELMIRAANGYVSPEAEAALHKALERDDANGPARYYWGLMRVQTGRPDLAFRVWEETLRGAPADAPWAESIRTQIVDLAYRAGVEYTPSADAQPSGPSRDQIEAAAAMTDQDRQQMIRGMVDQLSDRLATEGGSPQDWARLIGALGVLGETDRAQAIYDEARADFDGDTAARQVLDAAAGQAGLTQ